MEPRKIFINSAGRLRSGWRLVVFLLAFIVFLFLITSAVRVAYAAATYFAPGCQVRVLRPGRRVPINNSDFKPGRRLRLRSLAGRPALAFSRTVAACRMVSRSLSWFSNRDCLSGSCRGHRDGRRRTAFHILHGRHFPQVAKTLVLSGVLFIFAALAEEALFRGYPLQTLTRAALVPFGVVLTSLAFAAIHLQNPNVATGLAFV